MKLSLGQAAKAAGVGKTTLSRMISRGEISAAKAADGTYQIDESEVARVIAARQAPGRGRAVEAKASAAAAPAPDAVDAAVLRVQIENLRDRLAEAVRREEAAEARAAEALAREREATDRFTRLIEDQRPAAPRGLWSRLFKG